MEKMSLHKIRQEFLNFFKGKDHLVMPSFPLIPKDDKSLLLINAGMVPLKPYFVGEKKPPHKRAVTCQKCIRTDDIENVGKTDRHATFFEMLGNFSFGDYFKEEAIKWAWEFMTEKLNIPSEDLWISIYLDDDESFDIWHDKIGVDEGKIVRLGKEDNFWELDVGPGGPCSEIYVDRGEKYGCGKKDCLPGCDCDRFVEVWNLVFSQYDKDEEGNYNPLPNPNIDTGMGLERMAAIMQGADNIFEIEEIKGIIREVEKSSGIKYGENERNDASIRVITDHVRAAVFLVADGVLPSNEGRGYVLRRLIRRAARHGKLLGIETSFLKNIIVPVIDEWGDIYPDINEKQDYIEKIITVEEERFEETIHQGLNILDRYIEEMEDGKKEKLSGIKAFKLYDTYGFPLDLTKEILAEKGVSVDIKEFNEEMEKQKDRARKARSKGEHSGWNKTEAQIDLQSLGDFDTKFVGYTALEIDTKVLALIKDDTIVNKLDENEEGMVILKETPFYPESGGQVGDIGLIKGSDLFAYVTDTKYIKDDIISHFVKVREGSIKTNDKVRVSVNNTNRFNATRNHSATHLLHKALKDVLGQHVNQAGSLVLPDRLRFDFTHYERVSNEKLKEIEEIVNEKIFRNLPIYVKETSLEEAENMGAIALFDEKYQDKVRVIKIGDYSVELCGGTHVQETSQINMFKIIGESSVASGVRRIEAITGPEVHKYLNDLEYKIEEVSRTLKTNEENLSEKANSLMDQLRDKDKEIESLKAKLATSFVDEILEQEKEVGGIPVITYKVSNVDMDELRNLSDELRKSFSSGVIVLGSAKEESVLFTVTVSKELIDRGLHAGNMIKEIAKVAGGGGGGRPDMAQAGGSNPAKIDEALSIVDEIIEKDLK